MLLFTGRYPQPIFELALATERWTYRVVAYAGVMTDAYPPFQLEAPPSRPSPDSLD